MGTDPVTWLCHHPHSLAHRLCDEARADVADCGPAGKWFEDTPPFDQQTIDYLRHKNAGRIP